MVILKMTETQAGEYLLFIQSEATNYTVLFTVSIRSKCTWLLSIPLYQLLRTQYSDFPQYVVEWINSLQPSI